MNIYMTLSKWSLHHNTNAIWNIFWTFLCQGTNVAGAAAVAYGAVTSTTLCRKTNQYVMYIDKRLEKLGAD